MDNTKSKSNRKKALLTLFSGLFFLLVFIGATYSYMLVRLGRGGLFDIDATTGTTDSLKLTAGKPLDIKVTKTNFTAEAGNLIDHTSVTATLMANNTTNEATYTYNVYLYLNKNELTYTSPEKTPELLLQVIDPEENVIKEIEGLEYVTVGDVEGFDITTLQDLITISSDYEISTTGTTVATQTWEFSVILMNLESDQYDNLGRKVQGKFYASNKEKYRTNFYAAAIYKGSNKVPSKYTAYGNAKCELTKGVYDNRYDRLEITAIKEIYPECTITYEEPVNKDYLNEKIKNLSGTTQGEGNVVYEYSALATSTKEFIVEKRLDDADYTDLINDSNYAWRWNDENKTWTSTNKNHNTISTLTFTIAENGMYNFCYTQVSEQNYDYAQIYVNDKLEINLYSILTSSYQCKGLDNLKKGDKIKITYQKDGSGATAPDEVTFYIDKGEFDEDTFYADYRYEGKNPNNYVWFNDELWRIIGVFTSNSHGQRKEKLVKIIRNESIGTMVYDKSNNNNYTTASINQILAAYYNKADATDSDYCYGYSSTVPTLCDFRGNGIDSDYRKMIVKATWPLRGYNSASIITENMYDYERGSTKVATNPDDITAYVGLMYPSDYGYSVLSSSCSRNTSLSNYNTAACGGQSWLYGQGMEWTMTPTSSATSNYFINYSGQISTTNPNNGYSIRPVVYLKSSVYVLSGDGSIENPYLLRLS